MPEIDLNELRRRDPKAYHQRLLIIHQGNKLALKEKLKDARDSVERSRIERDIETQDGEIRYYRMKLEKLGKKSSS